MREWLTLLERAGDLLHLSRVDLPVGTILRPSGANLLDDDIEDALERNRPAERPARSAVVYMAANERSLENLTAWNGLLYRVRPNDPTIRLDHGWINMLFSLFARHEEEPVEDVDALAGRYAQGYWSGNRAPAPRWHPTEQPIWEYMAPSAVVLGLYQAQARRR